MAVSTGTRYTCSNSHRHVFAAQQRLYNARVGHANAVTALGSPPSGFSSLLVALSVPGLPLTSGASFFLGLEMHAAEVLAIAAMIAALTTAMAPMTPDPALVVHQEDVELPAQS